ncbi:MAG: CHRD domain-containing protein [Chitinophagaceae bacterium]
MKKNYNKIRLLLFYNFLWVLLLSFPANATIYPFHNTLTGSQEVPANASPGKGTIVGWYNDENNTISYTIIFSGLLAPTVAAHFHAPGPPGVNASVIIGYAGFPLGVTSGSYSNTHVITDLQETQLLAGSWYSNIHTSLFLGGEIRAQILLANPATTYIFNNIYSGSQEVPPNASAATGRIIGSYNQLTNTISYAIIFSGLTTSASAAHFHAPAPPGVNASVIIPQSGFPAAIAGTYSNTHVITDLQETQLLSNLWYANIHNATFPGGEIRAQIILNIPATITCPATIVLSNAPGQCSRSVSFVATATGNPAPAVTYKIGTTPISSPHTFPVGTTTVTATATNAAGTASCTFSVTVNDTQAPAISNLSASPNSLWPPNHKMKDVAVNYTTTDNCQGTITCSITVTSNEAVNGTGDGDTAPDWVVLDDHHVQLRAERAGNGNGRVYTITTTCQDQYGNSSHNSTNVTVQHDNGKSDNKKTLSMNDESPLTGLSLKILNNPSRNYFTLNIQTNNLDKMNVRLFDIYGRVVESKNNLAGSQVLRVGSNLKAGSYLIEVIQGKQKAQLKLVKIR